MLPAGALRYQLLAYLLWMCVLQALSRVGRCQTFEATADGYGRGEGFVALLLQNPASSHHSDAANPAPALAVVCGSAVNQDGRSSSLTAPNGPSQQVSLPPAPPR